MKVLGISTSPRVRGNTDILLSEALRGAKSQGAKIEKIILKNLRVSPCLECDRCFRKGECIIKDGMQTLYRKFLTADRIIFASPIYFMAHCAQAKMVIDRCQALWARKHVLQKPLFEKKPHPPRKGLFISVGGRKGKKLFSGAKITMKYFFKVLEMKYDGDLLYEQIDEKGAILNHPTAMKEVFKAGQELAK
ncbi:MAG: flavodoxin family protein [Nitrospirae bacterium]|nr:flavodoxin family protein [Nitrospirota bacterium]